MCVPSLSKLCAARSALLCLISRFVVWDAEVVHAHLQICLLHKSPTFPLVDVVRKLTGSEKAHFKHPQLLSCLALGILLIQK